MKLLFAYIKLFALAYLLCLLTCEKESCKYVSLQNEHYIEHQNFFSTQDGPVLDHVLDFSFFAPQQSSGINGFHEQSRQFRSTTNIVFGLLPKYPTNQYALRIYTGNYPDKTTTQSHHTIFTLNNIRI